jgi:hypothetical protein
MARAGLGPQWTCLLANEIDAGRAASYAANWGGEHFKVCDVARLTPADLPGYADLAWGVAALPGPLTCGRSFRTGGQAFGRLLAVHGSHARA